MEDYESPAKIIDDIRKLELCKTVYEFFAMLYHIANKHQIHLINRYRMDDNSYEPELSKLEVIQNGNNFTFYDDILDFINGIETTGDAVSLLIALIYKMDIFMSGISEHAAAAGLNKRYKSLPEKKKRLQNPYYYVPIKIPYYKETYMIAPYIEPVYFQWINPKRKLERDSCYLSQTIDHCFFEYHTIVKSNPVVKFVNEDRHKSRELKRFYRTLRPIESTGTLTIALASHDSGFSCAIETWKTGTSYSFKVTGIVEPDDNKRKNSIESMMFEALTYNVDILIFPEMVIDSYSLSVIMEWLKNNNKAAAIKLVAAGSFHCMEDGKHSNKSIMLGFSGNVLWEQRKLHKFAIKSTEMKEPMQEFLNIYEQVDVYEAIDVVEHSLNFIDTPIGRMATMICVDYLQTTIHSVFNQIKCGFLWIPVMTATIKKFEKLSDDPYSDPCKILSAVCAGQSMCGTPHSTRGDKSFLRVPVKYYHLRKSVRSKGIEKGKTGLKIYDIRKMVE
ncbi:MAG: hypothetical protein HQL00_00790 [Nitrospirae bacterium]|nr:hypothetical protein [Nitrospirota bacterium]